MTNGDHNRVVFLVATFTAMWMVLEKYFEGDRESGHPFTAPAHKRNQQPLAITSTPAQLSSHEIKTLIYDWFSDRKPVIRPHQAAKIWGMLLFKVRPPPPGGGGVQPAS